VQVASFKPAVIFGTGKLSRLRYSSFGVLWAGWPE
jgi:hypothetical protein